MIQRHRLLDLAGDASAVALVAPSGFGKSTFLDQLVAHGPVHVVLQVALHAGDRSPQRLLARMVEAAGAAKIEIGLEGLPDDIVERCARVAAVVERSLPAGAWVVFDDLHHASTESADALRAIVGRLGADARVRVALAGRSLPWRPADAVVVGEDALAFDRAETEEVFAEQGGEPTIDGAMVCRRRTRGWPAAVALWARQANGSAATGDAAGADESTVFDALLADALAGMSGEELGVLAALPLLSREIGVLVGWECILDDVTVSGLPLRRTGDWWSLGDVVRERLRGVHSTTPAALVAAATVYAHRGQLLHALDVLFGNGLHAHLPALLAQLDVAAVEHSDLVEMSAALEAAPEPALAAHPLALLMLAQAAETRALLPLRLRLLDRLSAVAATDEARLALEVERVRDLGLQGVSHEALQRGAAAMAALPADALPARVRCLYALGWAASVSDEPNELLAAGAYFAESAGLARSCRRDDDRARALNALAYRVHLKRAEYDRTIARFEEALAIVRPGSGLWAATLTFLAEALVAVGRDDEALEALSEARACARRLGDVRTVAYSAWSAAKVMARQRDRRGLHYWLADVDANRGDWYEHLTGAEFCAVAADLCAQCGDIDEARMWLARTLAHPRLPEYPDIAWPAECSIEVRVGDPIVAGGLVTRLLDEGYTEVRERWRYRLWLAWCHHRCGDVETMGELVAEVRREVAASGHPDLPELHEPEMWAVLGGAGGSEPAGIGQWRLQVLGSFSAVCDGQTLAIPGGKPTQLLKILAVAGRPLPLDEVAEMLWPAVDQLVGRRRLRNVVARVRGVGALLDRADDLLALNGAVSVDLHEFNAAAQSALRSVGDGRIAKADSALAGCAGELLPADRFEDWSVLPRERVRSLRVRLAEIVVDGATDRGDVDAVVSAIERMLDADPYGDHWADKASAVLHAAGHRAAAAMWAERAHRIRTDLGVV